MTAMHRPARWAPLTAALLLVTACSAPAVVPLAAGYAPTATSSSATATSAAPATTTTTASARAPVEVTSTVTEIVAVPFAVRTVDDATVDQGKRLLRTAGRAGSKTVTWLVRTRGGVEVGRTVSGEQVTATPVDEVTAVGTKVPAPAPKPTTTTPKPAPRPTQPAPPPAAVGNCDPNYSGGCVPVASDVDCAGGKGNGPAYVQGPVHVVGRDIYGLDADHDGVGCED